MPLLPLSARATAFSASFFALAAYGCSAHEPTGERAERVGSSQLPIIKGTQSPPDQDAVVALAVSFQGQTQNHCSGTLIAKNLVLTAHHCVGEMDDQGNVTQFPASMLSAYVGAAGARLANQGAAPSGKAKRVFTTGTFLVPDIALILLEEDIDGATIAPIRLTGGAKQGEPLTIVGFGIDETGQQPRVRMQRTGVSVTKIGPAMTTVGQIALGEFAFGEAACSGDSGGPALSATSKAVVGVASRVSNGSGHSSSNPAGFCVGTDTEDVYGSLDQVQDLVREAFTAAGKSPLLEGATPEPEKPKTEEPKSQPPSAATSQEPAPPPQPTTTTTTTTGCAATPRGNESTAAWALALGLGAAVSFARRRTSRRDD